MHNALMAAIWLQGLTCSPPAGQQPVACAGWPHTHASAADRARTSSRQGVQKHRQKSSVCWQHLCLLSPFCVGALRISFTACPVALPLRTPSMCTYTDPPAGVTQLHQLCKFVQYNSDNARPLPPSGSQAHPTLTSEVVGCLAEDVQRRTPHTRAGSNAEMSRDLLLPCTMSSATACPVAGPFRMPQQLCPVATYTPCTPGSLQGQGRFVMQHAAWC
jgi:hypothetical protein